MVVSVIFLEEKKTEILKIVMSKDVPGGVSSTKTVLNLVISVVGVGILALPSRIGQNGWAVSTGLFGFSCFLAHYTCLLLYKCIRANDSKSLLTYPALGELAFGKWGYIFVAITNYFNLLAICACLLILLGDALHGLTGLAQRTCTLISLSAVIPLTWLSSMSKVSMISAIGVGAAFVTLLAVVAASITRICDMGGIADVSVTPNNYMSMGVGFANFMNSYTVAPVVPTLIASMRNPDDFPRVSAVAFFIVSFIFACIGFGGYLGWGSEISKFGNVGEAIAASQNHSSLLWITELGIILICLTHFIALFQPIGNGTDIVARMILKRDRIGHVLSPLLRTLVVLFCLAVALLVPNFGNLVDLIGSTFVMLLQLIFPFLLGYRLIGTSTAVTVAAVTLGITGMVVGTYGVVSSV